MRVRIFLAATLMVAAGFGCDRAEPEPKPEVAPGCDKPESMRESEVVGLSNVEVYRGPLDMGGARVVGCLHNRSGEKVQKLTFFYKKMGGGGAGNRNLRFQDLEPEGSTPFVTDTPIEWDEKEGLDGLEFTSIGFDLNDTYDLDEPIELKPDAPRPAHKLEKSCADIDPTEGEGDVRLSHVQYEPLKLVHETDVHVIGCVTNRSDEPIATDDRIMKGGYQLGAKHSHASGGGVGDLIVEKPIPAGKSALFVYEVSFDEQKSDLRINPEGGPAVAVD